MHVAQGLSALNAVCSCGDTQISIRQHLEKRIQLSIIKEIALDYCLVQLIKGENRLMAYFYGGIFIATLICSAIYIQLAQAF